MSVYLSHLELNILLTNTDLLFNRNCWHRLGCLFSATLSNQIKFIF